MEYLNWEGRYWVPYASIEGARTTREDVDRDMAAICSVPGRSTRPISAGRAARRRVSSDGTAAPSASCRECAIVDSRSVDREPTTP